jgi:uncharacterized small protein (DUF1192 family)
MPRKFFFRRRAARGRAAERTKGKVMSRDDDDGFAAGKKPAPVQHAVGEPLDALSVDELAARIEILRAEISRLEAAKTAKTASRAAADAFFKT